jgi:hypothetical protein
VSDEKQQEKQASLSDHFSSAFKLDTSAPEIKEFVIVQFDDGKFLALRVEELDGA